MLKQLFHEIFLGKKSIFHWKKNERIQNLQKTSPEKVGAQQ